MSQKCFCSMYYYRWAKHIIYMCYWRAINHKMKCALVSQVLVPTLYSIFMKKGLWTYADSAAPDQHVHPYSLIWELHCPSIWDSMLQNIRQCSSQLGLCQYVGWSGTSLLAYIQIVLFHMLWLMYDFIVLLKSFSTPSLHF